MLPAVEKIAQPARARWLGSVSDWRVNQDLALRVRQPALELLYAKDMRKLLLGTLFVALTLTGR